MKHCAKCGKKKPMDNYVKSGKVLATCAHCREVQRRTMAKKKKSRSASPSVKHGKPNHTGRCNYCDKPVRGTSYYCDENCRQAHAEIKFNNPVQCACCKQYSEQEDFVGEKGTVTTCRLCRDRSKRRYRQEREKECLPPEYQMSGCPWESGQVRQVPYGGIM